jgi:hypothetical protein
MYASSQQSKAAKEKQNALKDGTKELPPPVDLPPAERINPGKVQNAYLKNVSGSMDYATGIADFVNRYKLGATLRNYRKMQPNFDAIQGQVGKNALSFARGELPEDVVDEIGRRTAETGIQGGYGQGSQGGKSGALGNAMLRNLGLTSLDLAKYGSELGMRVNQSAASMSPQVMTGLDLFASPGSWLGAEQFNVGQQNQFTLAQNGMENKTQYENTALGNNLNTAIAQSEYEAQVARAMAIQQASSSLGSLATLNLGATGKGGTAYNDAATFSKMSTGSSDSWRQNATGAFGNRQLS